LRLPNWKFQNLQQGLLQRAAPFDQLGDLFRRFPDEISPDLREFKVEE
jgi:hypothetical protein